MAPSSPGSLRPLGERVEGKFILGAFLAQDGREFEGSQVLLRQEPGGRSAPATPPASYA